ncbi:MAG: LamG-like jellyroll fold domain-containing protein [Planctomycetota bacterium]|jgi:parallel beta-helix repeat protein
MKVERIRKTVSAVLVGSIMCACAGAVPDISNYMYNNNGQDLFGSDARYGWIYADANDPNEPNAPGDPNDPNDPNLPWDPNDPNDPNEPNGLVAHWKFDEGANSIAYDSAGNNDGTLMNGPTWTSGVLDGALDFDGVDDYVEIPDDDSIDFPPGADFTIGLWFKSPTAINSGTGGNFLGHNDTSSGYFLGFHENDNGEISLGTNQGRVKTTRSQWTQQRWYYIVAVNYGSGVDRVYVDGVLDGTGENNYAGPPIAGEPLTIGRRSTYGTTNFFGGLIDDVRLYQWALSPEEVQQLYEEVAGPEPIADYFVDGVSGSDLNDGLTLETAFATIQKGVDEANDGETVLVYPAVYGDPVDFYGKAITVRGVATEAGVAIVETPMDYAFSFFTEEGPGSVLKNFVVRDCFVAAFLVDTSPTISNLTVVNNRMGIEAYAGAQPDIKNCIFYNNTNGDLNEPNEPNHPRFADVASGDYHLLSERGRYWPEHDVWVLDDMTSVCVDGGDPDDSPADEPMPNGGRINMGAYGGTAYASMSEWALRSDMDWDGRVTFRDFAIFAAEWLDFMPWAWNEPPEVIITSPDGSATVPYNTIDPVIIEADASDVEGIVVKVEFFADGSKVATDYNGGNGWQGAWHPPSDGPFTLTARATDDDGATTTSPPVQIEIGYVL